MIRKLIFAFGAMVVAAVATGPLRAQQLDATTNVASPGPETPVPSIPAADQAAKSPTAEAPAPPEAEALRQALSRLAPGASDEERNERAALVSFYETRGFAPLWLTSSGALNPKASLLTAEIKHADEWGFDPRDFPLPAGLEQGAAMARTEGATVTPPAPETIAAAEIGISQAVLKYGRYARGGRIIDPAEQLSSYLDRRPQLLKPQLILDGVAAAEQPDAYLRGLHPSHPQFEKLRQKYLALPGRNRHATAQGKKLLANMEEWRWMPADMGDLYVWNNIPEFLQRVVKNGQVVRKERIVAGETGKQTPIFTRPMRKITFKPTWIVPDSIKVRELWPNLLRGGGLMRQWALEVRAKDGKQLDWRRMNWTKVDIREYDVIQLNGPKNVMGKVKFSFPNQHTVFMHDTLERDKWMFRAARRTYSHGCMRVANPIGLAEILLREDKGWDPTRVVGTLNTGPLNNEIALDHKIPVHITYFTALVGDDGKLQTFPDVYGHERRITLALEGKWDQIVKGRDHLAPVELDLADAPRRRPAEDEASDLPGWHRRNAHSGGGGILSSILGGDGM